MMPKFAYRKSAAAKPSYALYTRARPASWDVYVDDVLRGAIVGYAPQYSGRVAYVVTLDGVRVRATSVERLRDAKAAFEEAFALNDRSMK